MKNEVFYLIGFEEWECYNTVIKLCDLTICKETILTCNMLLRLIWSGWKNETRNEKFSTKALSNLCWKTFSIIVLKKMDPVGRRELSLLNPYGRWRSRWRWWMINGGIQKEEWSMCTHKSINRIQVDLSHKTKSLIKPFLIFVKNGKRTLCVHFKWVRRKGCFI